MPLVVTAHSLFGEHSDRGHRDADGAQPARRRPGDRRQPAHRRRGDRSSASQPDRVRRDPLGRRRRPLSSARPRRGARWRLASPPTRRWCCSSATSSRASRSTCCCARMARVRAALPEARAGRRRLGRERRRAGSDGAAGAPDAASSSWTDVVRFVGRVDDRAAAGLVRRGRRVCAAVELRSAGHRGAGGDGQRAAGGRQRCRRAARARSRTAGRASSCRPGDVDGAGRAAARRCSRTRPPARRSAPPRARRSSATFPGSAPSRRPSRSTATVLAKPAADRGRRRCDAESPDLSIPLGRERRGAMRSRRRLRAQFGAVDASSGSTARELRAPAADDAGAAAARAVRGGGAGGARPEPAAAAADEPAARPARADRRWRIDLRGNREAFTLGGHLARYALADRAPPGWPCGAGARRCAEPLLRLRRNAARHGHGAAAA